MVKDCAVVFSTIIAECNVMGKHCFRSSGPVSPNIRWRECTYCKRAPNTSLLYTPALPTHYRGSEPRAKLLYDYCTVL